MLNLLWWECCNMSVKDTYIRVRVTTEEKERIKEVANAEGVSMSELMLVATEREIKKHQEKTIFQKILEDRAIRTEKKLAKITERIRSNKKPIAWKFMFWVGKL